MGVFDTIECEKEAVLALGFGTHEVFDAKELAFLDDGEDALMGVGAGEAGELVARLQRDSDACGSA